MKLVKYLESRDVCHIQPSDAGGFWGLYDDIHPSFTKYYTEGSLDEKSVTRIGSCQGGECINALAKNCIPASA